jgi:hypothetical protein
VVTDSITCSVREASMRSTMPAWLGCGCHAAKSNALPPALSSTPQPGFPDVLRASVPGLTDGCALGSVSSTACSERSIRPSSARAAEGGVQTQVTGGAMHVKPVGAYRYF